MDLTLGAIYQDMSADGHGDVNEGVGDLRQVRFEEESLDDEWYQLALTFNASLPFGDLVVAGSYFDRKFAYEADASDYEFSLNCPKYDVDYNPNPPPPFCQPNFTAYDFGGDPRGFATNSEDTEIDDAGSSPAVEGRCREPLVLARGRLLQQGDQSHRVSQLRARLRGHGVVRLLQ